MVCKRCGELPKIDFETCQVYLYIPTKHHIEPINNLLSSLKLEFVFRTNYFLFMTDDFKELIERLESIEFNILDQKDIKIMPMVDQELNFDELNNLKSLKDWISLYEGDMVLDVLKHKRIKVLFQPIIDVKNKKIYGYEALIRGLTRKNSIIPPNILFDKAKAMDLNFFLDRLCRETVIRIASEMSFKDRLFVNFIPTAIYNPRKCLKTTDEAVEGSNLEPGQITFEVVETECVRDYNHLNDILNYYKEKGYSTALDDMGSGYANKSSLLSLNPDFLKIDMNIIQGIHEDQEKQGKLGGYLELAKDRNIKVLAEGVETREDLEYIISQKIDLVQGYYFQKPSEVLLELDLEKKIP